MQPLQRLRDTRVHRRYIVPALSLLRWEGVILVGALGAGLAAAFLVMAWARAFDEGKRGRLFLRRAQSVGVWLWGLLLLLVGMAVFWRFTTWWGAGIFAVIYAVVALWHLRWLRSCDTRPALRFKQIVALSITPILLAWVVNSTIYLGVSRVVAGTGRQHNDEAVLTERRTLRQQAVEAWAAEGAAPVAVALSGGGYRAAVVHAGLLSALDGAGVPVHYLSTVSGGSIVGATYARGPDHFRRQPDPR